MRKKATKNSFPPQQSINLKGNKWCVTIHGANPDGNCPILNLLKTQFQKDDYPLVAIAYQTGLHGIHPHWQIYFQTAEHCRMKQKFLLLLGEDISFHLELARGTRNANLKYVYAVEKQHQIGWLHYTKGHSPPASYRPYKTQNLLRLRNNMKPWQKELLQKVTTTADYRDILWIWQPIGNSGKTYLAKYLHYFYGAIITGGKAEDMKHAISRWKQITGHYPITIIVDLARSDTIPKSGYKALEEIKNALFFSGKYQSGMVASCNPPNVIVFANTPPKLTAMSSDRWLVKTINPESQELETWTPTMPKKNAKFKPDF